MNNTFFGSINSWIKILNKYIKIELISALEFSDRKDIKKIKFIFHCNFNF